MEISAAAYAVSAAVIHTFRRRYAVRSLCGSRACFSDGSYRSVRYAQDLDGHFARFTRVLEPCTATGVIEAARLYRLAGYHIQPLCPVLAHWQIEQPLE